MRYKVVMWPMFNETLAIVTTNYEHYTTGTDYTAQYQLKTEGAEWDLAGRLRELADQIDGASA